MSDKAKSSQQDDPFVTSNNRKVDGSDMIINRMIIPSILKDHKTLMHLNVCQENRERWQILYLYLPMETKFLFSTSRSGYWPCNVSSLFHELPHHFAFRIELESPRFALPNDVQFVVSYEFMTRSAIILSSNEFLLSGHSAINHVACDINFQRWFSLHLVLVSCSITLVFPRFSSFSLFLLWWYFLSIKSLENS